MKLPLLPYLPAKREKHGSALVIAVMLSLVVVFLMAVGGKLIETSYSETRTQQKVITEADNVARAGLIDAIAWFKRQTQQPVRSGVPPTIYSYPDAAFYPRYSTDETKSATIDESVGLVKEYALSGDGSKWARYELVRQKDPSSNDYDPHAVHDITSQRIDGKDNGEGLVWYLESVGYVYMRRDPTKAYNVFPNTVISRVRASTEIRRLSLSLPAQAASVVYDGGTVTLNKNGRIIAGNNIGSSRNTGNAPTVNSGATLSGSPTSKSSYGDTTLVPTVNYVLGVSTSELKMMADYVVTDTSQLPTDLPDMSLIFVDGNAVFSSTQPLVGSGILFVNGSMWINSGSNSFYSGLVYTTGKAYIYGPASVGGSVVSYNGLTLSQSGSVEIAEIDYDDSILSSVRQKICQYRENKSSLYVFIGVPGLK